MNVDGLLTFDSSDLSQIKFEYTWPVLQVTVYLCTCTCQVNWDTFWLILMRIQISSFPRVGWKWDWSTFKSKKRFNLSGHRIPNFSLAVAVLMPRIICINGSRDLSALHSGNISCLPQNRFVLCLSSKRVKRKGRCGITETFYFMHVVWIVRGKTYWKLLSTFLFAILEGIPDIPLDQWFWPLY